MRNSLLEPSWARKDLSFRLEWEKMTMHASILWRQVIILTGCDRVSNVGAADTKYDFQN